MTAFWECTRAWYFPKTKTSYRKVDVGPETLTALKEWKLACPPNELDLVFPNRAENPMNHNNMVSRHFDPALKRAEIRRVRFHDLRHTNASFRIERGESIKYIQTQLGHASPTVTLNVYEHLLKDSNPEAARGIENTLFNGTGHNLVTNNKKRVTI